MLANFKKLSLIFIFLKIFKIFHVEKRMGANLSNEFTSNTLSSLTQVVNSTVSNVVQNASTSCAATNAFEGFYGIYPVRVTATEIDTLPCTAPTNIQSLTITQNAANTCNLTGGITSDIQDQITNQLSSNINSWISQTATQNNGWLGIGINIAASESYTQAQISSLVANTLTVNISQTCSSILDASNQAKVYVCGNYPNGIVVVQNAVSTNLTSCIINNAVTAIMSNTVLNNIVTKTTQQVSQTNEGIFSGLKWIIIAAVIIAVLIIIGVILYFVFGGSKAPAPTNAQNAKEREKRMLERELIEKRERAEGKPANSLASFTTRGNADESARQLFERHDELTSPTYLDRFRSLASRYGGVAEAEL